MKATISLYNLYSVLRVFVHMYMEERITCCDFTLFSIQNKGVLMGN